jgi:hypothetical protein
MSERRIKEEAHKEEKKERENLISDKSHTISIIPFRVVNCVTAPLHVGL